MEIAFPAVLHGGDYNPEQWPESVWDDDVRLMQQAHVNLATLPVFGWVSLQPEEETFTFEWLDSVIEKLTAGGIYLCLATATASVPAWLPQKYPDVLRVDNRGVRLKHGGRHTFCPNSENFRRLSTNLARRLAERYGTHPGLVIWHISNEYGSHCYCDQCGAAFRNWLEKRYGSLEEVNRRWNAKFWGKTFTHWSQIEPPSEIAERSLQGMLIDYDRFQSHSVLQCCVAERDVLREFTPNVPITTNLMGAFKPLDYQIWAKELDIVSWDSYPSRGATQSEIAFSHSLMRGLKDGQSFMLMEQTPSQQNWQAYNSLKRPGVMRLWSYQAMAHGADTVMYFQWRRSRGAQEKYHGAVVEHAGRSDVRVFREVAALGKELNALGTATLGGRVDTKAAVLFDWDNWRAVEYSSGPSIDLKYHEQARRYYDALHHQGITADIVSPESDLSHYAIVLAPVLYMVKPGVAERIAQFVEAGGTFLTTYFSGLVDETDLVYLGGYPGPLRKILGLWVEETDVISPMDSNSVVFSRPFGSLLGPQKAGLLCDRIHPETATVLATYGEDFYAGEAAITVNTVGRGKAYYLGTQLNPEALQRLVQKLCDDAGVLPPMGSQPAGIEVVSRISPSGDSLFYVLNHSTDPQTVTLPTGVYTDLLSGKSLQIEAVLEKYGVAILRRC